MTTTVRTRLGRMRRRIARPRPPAFLVTGTGRCGTSYTAALLSEAGLHCGHEKWFTVERALGRPGPGDYLDGDCSWMAAHLLHQYSGVVLHQVRHPLRVVGSMVGGHVFTHPAKNRAWSTLAGTVFDSRGDDLVDAVRFYVDWNRLIEPYAVRRFKVEELDVEVLGDLCELVGHPRPRALLEQAVQRVPRDLNTKGNAVELGWDDLPPGQAADELVDLAARYGYQPP